MTIIQVSTPPPIQITVNSGAGPQGPTGATGATGPVGPAGTWDDQIRWIDLLPTPFSQGPGNSALTLQSVRDTPYQAYFFRRDQDDALSMAYQMPHSWVYGSEIRPHVHAIGHGTTGGDVLFRFQWCWTSANLPYAIPQLVGWQSTTVVMSIAIGDLFEEVVVGPLITPPAWAQASSHLHLVCTRVGTDPLDTFDTSNPTGAPQANLELVSLDCHVQEYGPGTVTEWP